MRELKFRGWDKKRKRMFVATTINASGSVSVFMDDGLYLLPAEQVELMQYTGLKDKNGKEIYVGDIVRAEDDAHYLVGVVEWNEDYGKYEVIYNQISGNSFDFEGDNGYSVANSCKVIGNIYEKPELLESKK